jgi:Fe2+ transport system protein FeoA
LFRLIVSGELDLQAEVLPPKLSKLAPGQPATIEVPGRGEIAGYVRSVSPITSERTQTASARIFIGDQKLPIGAFAKAVIVVGESCGPSVPLSAIVYGADGAIVQVLRDNRIETRLVSVGVLSDGNVEIREGLTAGEIVVQRSGAFLRDGDLVRSLLVRGAP